LVVLLARRDIRLTADLLAETYMATAALSSLPADWNFADVLASLGDVPAERIRAVPPPGTATESDVIEAESRWGRICELIDGVLVEKTMGWRESLLAALFVRLLGDFAEKHALGVVLGADGAMRILPHQVRVPDVSFI
jgi:hypothetical protein